MTPQRIENIRRFHRAFTHKIRTDRAPLNMAQQAVIADMLADLLDAADTRK